MKWVFKLHRLGSEPGHLRILPDSALWKKMYKEQLSHLDLNSGEAETPPTLCPLLADVTPICNVHQSVSTLAFLVIVGLDEPEVRPSFVLHLQSHSPYFVIKIEGAVCGSSPPGAKNSSHSMPGDPGAPRVIVCLPFPVTHWLSVLCEQHTLSPQSSECRAGSPGRGRSTL